MKLGTIVLMTLLLGGVSGGPAVYAGQSEELKSIAGANAAHNATASQQQARVTEQAATTMGVSTLDSLDTASTGVATKKIVADGSGAEESESSQKEEENI